MTTNYIRLALDQRAERETVTVERIVATARRFDMDWRFVFKKKNKIIYRGTRSMCDAKTMRLTLMGVFNSMFSSW